MLRKKAEKYLKQCGDCNSQNIRFSGYSVPDHPDDGLGKVYVWFCKDCGSFTGVPEQEARENGISKALDKFFRAKSWIAH
jgi:hypothetical protein